MEKITDLTKSLIRDLIQGNVGLDNTYHPNDSRTNTTIVELARMSILLQKDITPWLEYLKEGMHKHYQDNYYDSLMRGFEIWFEEGKNAILMSEHKKEKAWLNEAAALIQQSWTQQYIETIGNALWYELPHKYVTGEISRNYVKPHLTCGLMLLKNKNISPELKEKILTGWLEASDAIRHEVEPEFAKVSVALDRSLLLPYIENTSSIVTTTTALPENLIHNANNG